MPVFSRICKKADLLILPTRSGSIALHSLRIDCQSFFTSLFTWKSLLDLDSTPSSSIAVPLAAGNSTLDPKVPSSTVDL